MAHFAKIDENNIVTEVLVIEQAEVNTGNWGDPASFVQTSYNTRGGIYYTPNTSNPDPDQSKALRKNYAGIGYTYDRQRDAFIPPKPFPSWVLDEFAAQWKAPIPMPTPNNPPKYYWDESIVSWVEQKPPYTDLPTEVL